MIVKHYNRSKGNKRRIRQHPDLELDNALKAREEARVAAQATLPWGSNADLRRVGVVSPPGRVKVTRPKHVRRNDGYYKPNGNKLGARYTTQEAGYLEFSRDVARSYKPKVRDAAKAATPQHVSLPETARLKVRGHDFTSH